MNKIFVCPSLAGCHLPLYKSYHTFIGAKNINEAKKYMEEHIEEYKTTTIFLLDKITRNDDCLYYEEMFSNLNKMMKKE